MSQDSYEDGQIETEIKKNIDSNLKKDKENRDKDEKKPRTPTEMNKFVKYIKEQYYPSKKGPFERIPLLVVKYYFERHFQCPSDNNSLWIKIADNWYNRGLNKINKEYVSYICFVKDDNENYVLSKDGHKIVDFQKAVDDDGNKVTKRDRNGNPIPKKTRKFEPKSRPQVQKQQTTDISIMAADVFFHMNFYDEKLAQYVLTDKAIAAFIEWGDTQAKDNVLKLAERYNLDHNVLSHYGCQHLNEETTV